MTCRRDRGGRPPGFAGGNTADRTSHSAFVRSPRATPHPTNDELFKHALVGDESNLHRYLKAKTHPRAATGGFFLRAEAMHSYLRAIDSTAADRRAWGHEKVSERSHGESFLAVLRHRFVDQGVYFLDEPESALSFHSSLTLLALLDTMRAEGSQIILATRSPLLASLPGATIFELGDWGIRQTPWEDLELVESWRDYLRAPERWLRLLTADPD
ncbi:AAA family ATPase [Cryptosporangium sp. NPDC048952]|uniref:AAA family ATPase n=1 Tax=Cryptosporangium sp. NPDC048952 TaxID=3363961 RepID=UPI003720D9D3